MIPKCIIIMDSNTLDTPTSMKYKSIEPGTPADVSMKYHRLLFRLRNCQCRLNGRQMHAVSYHIPSPPCLVAFTAAMIFSCVDIVGSLSTTWSTDCGRCGRNNLLYNDNKVLRAWEMIVISQPNCWPCSQVLPTGTRPALFPGFPCWSEACLIPRLSLLERGLPALRAWEWGRPHSSTESLGMRQASFQ